MRPSPFFKPILLASGICALLSFSFAHAQTATPNNLPAGAPATPDTAQTASPPASATASLETLLAAHSEITLDDLLRDSGLTTAKLTPEARTKLERALNERNEDVRRANARVADEMRRALNVSDAQIAKSISEEDERRRMDRMRRFQPKRYEALMREQRKAQEKQKKE